MSPDSLPPGPDDEEHTDRMERLDNEAREVADFEARTTKPLPLKEAA